MTSIAYHWYISTITRPSSSRHGLSRDPGYIEEDDVHVIPPDHHIDPYMGAAFPYIRSLHSAATLVSRPISNTEKYLADIARL